MNVWQFVVGCIVGLSLGSVGLQGQALLSEFQASNVLTLEDEDGNSEDWIEVYNPGDVAIELGGWSLTDDPTRLTKWRFPATTLGPGEFLVVFASNKDRRIPGRQLHTNFKLGSSGEYLALVKPDGVTVATEYSPAFPAQADDLSYGLPVVDRGALFLGAGAPGRLVVPRDASLGTNWLRPDYDDTDWMAVRTGVGYAAPGAFGLVPVADSVTGWSAAGVQGAGGWYYGYYNRTEDTTPGYQASEFVAFPRGGVEYGPGNFWNGSRYRWPSATAPWDMIGPTDAHPNGENNGAEHWVIRRWVSTTDGAIEARWRLAKTNPNGSGVTGQVYWNGILQDSASIGGGDVVGVDRTVVLPAVAAGDAIDLVLTPAGPEGGTDDVSDGSANSLTVSARRPLTDLLASDVGVAMAGVNASAYVRLPFEVGNVAELSRLKLRMRYNDGFIAYLNGTLVAARNAPVGAAGGVLASSGPDWSVTGQQGFNNWYYGYYDKEADPDRAYDPYADFETTDSRWAWNGGAWVLGPGNPPHDMIAAGSWFPNGANSGGVHWVIRRWVAEEAGNYTVRITFRKVDGTCGTGATLRLLQNGVPRFDYTLAYNDTVGVRTNVVLRDIQAGDLLDFALDPLGTDGAEADSCDSTTVSVELEQHASAGPVWNSTATAARSPDATTKTEEIDLTARRDLLVAGVNVLTFQGMNATPDDGDFLLLPELEGAYRAIEPGARAYFAQPTPGAANGPGALELGPIVSEVSRTPQVPAATEELSVQARVGATLRPVGAVTLNYRVMYGAETALGMYDDGAHGDAAAGDGIYGARIPANRAQPGQMIRYYIVAADTAGQPTRWPSYSDPLRSPEFDGTVVGNPALTNSRLPVLHWFIASAAAANTDAGTRCSLFYDGEFYDNVGVNVHGQSTRGFPKKSYDLEFNPGFNFRWSDAAPRVGDLNLLTTWADKAHMRNALAHETYRDAGAPCHFAFPVRVQQNGSFFSVANVVEDAGGDWLERLGLDPRGALYKMYNSATSTADAEKKTRKHEGTADLAALIAGMSQGSATAVQTYFYDNLDVPEMIDFLAAKIITADTDCCHKNYYLYRDSDGTGEWQAMPWDVDLSFGRVWTCGSPCLNYFDETIYTTQSLFIGSGNNVFGPLFSTTATRQMYLRRLRTLMDTLFQPPGTPATNDFYRLKTLELRDRIAPDAALDLAKWGTWGTRETITQAVDRIWNEFLPGRRKFLFQTMSVTNRSEIPLEQPADVLVQIGPLEFRAASGNPAEEWVAVTNANTYAVDISGWELTGGVRFRFKPGTVLPAHTAAFVSPDVKAFRARSASPKGGERRLVVGPYDGDLSAWGETLTLRDTGGRLVDSRAYEGSPSAAQRYLRVTEIMYHAAPLDGHPDIDPSQLDFIELRNTGPAALDLRGVRFAGGIFFDFATAAVATLGPGARLVLAADTNAFALRYAAGVPLAGQYTGNLDSAGERLRLEDGYGDKILEFEYDNAWVRISDGPGFSLAIVDDGLPWSDWELPGSWRANGVLHGTPGAPDPLLPLFPPVLINEILAHTSLPQQDAIELHNAGSVEVDVGGWYLTDDFAEPRKFRLPSPTRIPAGGFVHFTEADFNPAPGVFPSFALSSGGEEVWLFSGDAAGNLTGSVAGFEFGATANGISLGRYENSVGDVDYPALVALTLGATNAAPRVGPVVISEIMYHPPDLTEADQPASYIELANIGTTDVPLADGADAMNAWRLAGAVQFAFPPGTDLPAQERLLVVGFDPATDAAALAAFRSRYNVAAAVPVFGPWEGRLGNSDDTVRLEQTEPVGAEEAAYGLVEKVHYLDRDPWPAAADGAGSSLQRNALGAYANDPANWYAAAPNPGLPNTPNAPPAIKLVSPVDGSVLPAGREVELVAEARAAVGTIQRLRFYTGANAIAELSDGADRCVWSAATAGAHPLTVVAHDTFGGVSTSAVVTVAFASWAEAAATAVPSGSRWKYLDDGSNQGTAWAAPGFDDTAWKSGLAELGYGDTDEGRPEATQVSYGQSAAQKHITTYFRLPFTVTNALLFKDLTVSLLRDDGAAVYLNGAEVFRSNLPDGTIDYRTRASSAVSDIGEVLYYPNPVSPLLLRDGANVLAVEVHQSAPNSTDLSFDLALVGTRIQVAPAFLEQPASIEAERGDSVVLSARVGGTLPLSYRWEFAGAALPGATGSTLVLTNLDAARAGVYRLLVSNSVGSASSDAAMVSLRNRPPAVADDGLLVPQGESASVTVAELLANDADPDGGSIAFVGVGPTGVPGATAVWRDDRVVYTPALAFTGADRFAYTVIDSHGSTATGGVAVLVYRGALPGTGGLILVPKGEVYLLRYAGSPGATCELQRSANLEQWSALVSTPVPPHGIVEQEVEVPTAGAVFFRVLER